MSEKHLVDACLRVVSNRCRNLRKTIDRAKSLQQVAENGTELNEEQQESIRSVPRKEALLAELQEILRKQTIVVTSSSPAGTGIDPETKPTPDLPRSKDPGDASKAICTEVNDDEGLTQTTQSEDDIPSSSADMQVKPAINSEEANVDDLNDSVAVPCNESVKSESPPSDSKDVLSSGPGNIGAVDMTRGTEAQQPGVAPTQLPLASLTEIAQNTASDEVGGISKGYVPSVLHQPIQPYLSSSVQNALSDPCSEKVALLVQEIESRHAIQLRDAKDECARQILNFFHVADFLHQSGSREALLCYFDTAEGKNKPRRVSGLDMDLIVYFNVMLTTPNGSVPHGDAVDVSTAHCLEFLKRSTSEAFKGTSYATLVDIVNAISTCPILTDRGKSQRTTSSKVPSAHADKKMGSANGHASSAMGSSVSAV